MKYYWSDEKCGDHALVITWYDLHTLIMAGAREFFEEHPYWIESIRKNSDGFNDQNFGIMANIITKKVENQKLSPPFEGLEKKVKKALTR